MKMLTIHRPNLAGPNDFCYGIDGELCMTFTTTCDNRDCGCDRAAVGLNSAQASTTVRVTELDIDHNDAAVAVMGYLSNSGWCDLFDSVTEIRAASDSFVTANAEVAQGYPEGTVLRPRYDRDANRWVFTEAGV
jgi:hypothetical protein